MSPLPQLVRPLVLSFISVILCCFLITGCSNDNISVELSGQVDHTLPAGTKICLDTDNNGQCDPNEPMALTNADGSYALTIPVKIHGKFPIVVESSENISTPLDLSTPAGKYRFISIISTAIQDRIAQASSLRQAEQELRLQYDIPQDVILYSDYQEPDKTLDPEHVV